jgi:hypothetical protein
MTIANGKEFPARKKMLCHVDVVGMLCRRPPEEG